MSKEEIVRGICNKAVNEQVFPGINVLYIRDNKEIYYYETGYADIENKVPFKRDTICRLFSASKVITAAAVWKCIEDGKLYLDHMVKDFLPGFRNLRVDKDGVPSKPARALRVRDLLSMQSGLLYNGKDLAGIDAEERFRKIQESCESEQGMTTVEVANYLGEGIARFEPTKGWVYGSSADILGALVEVASGMRFGEFLKNYFFEPLEMKDTGFFVPEEKLSRLATPYKTVDGALVRDFNCHLGMPNTATKAPNFESGGGGLYSTIDDLSAFCQMLLNEGTYKGKSILNKATVRAMRTPQLTTDERVQYWNYFKDNRGYSFGNLMRIMEDPGIAYSLGSKGEYGWNGWMGCYLSVVPEHKGVILMMTQKCEASYSQTTKFLRDAYYLHFTD